MKKGFIETKEIIERDEFGIERRKTVSKTFTHNVKKDNFYMIYVDYIKWIYGLDSASTFKVLMKLLEKAEFNTGEVNLSSGSRSKMMKELSIGKASFSRALNQLVEHGAIHQVVNIDDETGEQSILKGCYIIDPTMFWKGDADKRSGLKVTFETLYDNDKSLKQIGEEEFTEEL